MKKLIRISICLIFVIAICLGLISCSNEEYRQIEQQLLAVQGKGGHVFINKDGYVKDNKAYGFLDMIIAKMQEDKVSVPKALTDDKDGAKAKLYTRVHDEYAYFALEYNVNYHDSKADEIIGYINVLTNDVVYFSTQITTNMHFALQLNPHVANDNYFIFKMLSESVYYVIDVKNKVLIERIDDVRPYEDGTEYDYRYVYAGGLQYELMNSSNDKEPHDKKALKCGDETLELDYNYVLSRSEEMKEINSIVKGHIGNNIETTLLSYGNTLYIVFETQSGMLVRKRLKPIVFEYKIETDSFEYIGYTNLLSFGYVLGVIPYA